VTVGAVVEWVAPFAVDVRLTLSVQGRGRGDPTFQVDEAGTIWRTSLTPDGPGTIRVWPAQAQPTVLQPTVLQPTVLQPAAPQPTGNPSAAGLSAGWAPGQTGTSPLAQPQTRVRAQAWGPGAGWLLGALPGILGLYDDISGFAPDAHPLIDDAARRHPGLRLGRSLRLMEALVPAILEQKVVILEAHRAWRILLNRFGTQPPGPAPRGMRVFPAPQVWRRIPSWEWHQAGVEGVRAETIIRAASVADSLERLLALSHQEADRKLRTIPGIGVWTSAEARQRAAGDPDAVSVGDYHLKNVVGWALAGRRRSTDEEMLTLLEPFKGHRYRTTRLIGLSGGTGTGAGTGTGPPGGIGAVGGTAGIARYGKGTPPRRGPRMPVRDYRRF
jgi:3-methyladenine DNA glycosylase/8-oxoguanine DNA glycosylase